MFRRFYGRRSQWLGDPDDLDIFAHQIQPLLRRAAAEGCSAEPAEVVAEVGSGETIADRPRFRRIVEEMEGLRPGSGGELWASDVDRLSRGEVDERARIQSAMQRAGLFFRSASRSYDLTDPDDVERFENAFSRSRNERQRILARLSAGKAELSRRNLLVTGRPPAAYLWDRNGDGTLVQGRLRGCLRPHPERFELWQRIVNDALTMSLDELAALYRLNPSTIQWNLRNPVLAGYAVRRFQPHRGEKAWGRQKSVKIPRAEWDWPEEPGAWPAVCSRAEWEAVQEALDRRGTLKGRRDFLGNGWCRGVVAFAGVPGPARLSSLAGHRREPVPVYEKVIPGRPRLYVDRRLVHDHVEAELLAMLAHRDLVLVAAADYRRRREEETARRTGNEPERLRRRQEKLRGQLDELLLREIDAQGEEAASVARVRERVRVDLLRVVQELQALRPAEERVPALEVEPAALEELLQEAAGLWAEMEGPERQAAVATFITKAPVEVLPPELGKRPYRRRCLPLVWRPWLARHVK